jgi:streptogramin lyase
MKALRGIVFVCITILLVASLFACSEPTPPGPIYLADSNNNRIVRIDDMSGAGRINYSAAEGAPYLEPFQITVDRRGHIYVADGSLNQAVRIDTINGDGLLQFGSTGAGQDEFDHLNGVFCY